jgi:recombination protein RecR
MQYARPLEQLMAELEKLPGVGPKSAQRLAFHILKAPAEEASALAEAIARVKTAVAYCTQCFNYTVRTAPPSSGDLCPICADPQRDHSTICVVEEPSEIIALERMGQYRGVYHVLQGVLSPLDNIGPDAIRIAELVARAQAPGVREVILATSPTPEGEATAEYIRERLSGAEVTVTRIGLGLPIGGDLDYADDITLARAIEGRREM